MTAKKWTCEHCGVSISQMSGERVSCLRPGSNPKEGTFCLICRRERAAQAALDAAPANSPLERAGEAAPRGADRV